MNERTLEVLEQYDLEIRAFRRGRGAWLCETEQGLKLLREYKGTNKRLEFEAEVLAFLQEEGGLSVDQYVKNREGGLISTAADGNRYIVKDWYTERECSLLNEEEAVRAVKGIAELHKILRRIKYEETWNLGSILTEPWELQMERHNRELRRVRSFISKKRKKNEFELSVMETFPAFFEQAQKAAEGMERMRTEGELPRRYFCHGELNQHHILMGNGTTIMIEFHRMHLGVQMGDIYHFIRKVMEKHGWECRLGHKLLAAYDRILPLDRAELEYLYYLFLYPEKYWKQLNFYYNAGKTWIPQRNAEKIQKLAAQQEMRNHYLRELC